MANKRTYNCFTDSQSDAIRHHNQKGYGIKETDRKQWATTLHCRYVWLCRNRIHTVVHSWWRPLTSAKMKYNITSHRRLLRIMTLTLTS